MKTYEQLESDYVALCEAFCRDARHITGLCLAGRTEAAGKAAAVLAQSALTHKIQHDMTKEVATSDYDLTTLPPVHRES